MPKNDEFSFGRAVFGGVFVSVICGFPFIGLFFSAVCFGTAIIKIFKFSANRKKDIGFMACFAIFYLVILFLTSRTDGGQTDGGALFFKYQWSGVVVGLMLPIGWLFSPFWREKHD